MTCSLIEVEVRIGRVAVTEVPLGNEDIPQDKAVQELRERKFVQEISTNSYKSGAEVSMSLTIQNSH